MCKKCIVYFVIISFYFLGVNTKSLAHFMSSIRHYDSNIDYIPNPSIDSNTVFITVDLKAKFKGGFTQFIDKNIRYPNSECITGKVILQFIVNPHGAVSSIKILKSLSNEADEEAIRLIQKTSGMWEPGKRNGIQCESYYVLPIFFRLD